jgi:predicted AAA+ superfamily ATPase
VTRFFFLSLHQQPLREEAMERKSFVYGVPVIGYNFTGREEETRRLLADFQGGINVILMSPRRLGKTSLVKHTLQQVDRKQVMVVYVDICLSKP